MTIAITKVIDFKEYINKKRQEKVEAYEQGEIIDLFDSTPNEIWEAIGSNFNIERPETEEEIDKVLRKIMPEYDKYRNEQDW